jgi:hypothetical protein
MFITNPNMPLTSKQCNIFPNSFALNPIFIQFLFVRQGTGCSAYVLQFELGAADSVRFGQRLEREIRFAALTALSRTHRYKFFTSEIAAVGQVSTTSTQSHVSQSPGLLATATFSVTGSSLG